VRITTVPQGVTHGERHNYWLSSNKMTVTVETELRTYSPGHELEIIIESPPITRRFVGQPIRNLIDWMHKQGGFKMERSS
jgi:hypothetical protein